MIELRQTPDFAAWFDGLRDKAAKGRIGVRLARVEGGNFGDWKSVGDGVGELRLSFGPGYRIYFTRRGEVVMLLLCGGDKDGQRRDIERAKELAQAFTEEDQQ